MNIKKEGKLLDLICM